MHGATHATKATQRTMHKHAKQCKKQKKCYKNMQKYAKRETTMAFKKPWQHFKANKKEAPQR